MRPTRLPTSIVLLATLFTACTGGSPVTSASGSDGGPRDAAPTDDAANALGCHVDSECADGSFDVCIRDEDPSCGRPPRIECSLDSQCATDGGADRVCASGECGDRLCQPRCTGYSDCRSAYPGSVTCSPTTGLCEAAPCARESDCPANFACGADHRCAWKTCTRDGDCAGFCVDGVCSSSLGTCRPIPA